VVERVAGRHGDPSALAFGFSDPVEQLYRVRFLQRDLWPEQHDEQHDDVVEVEIFENWLEPAVLPLAQDTDADAGRLFDHSGAKSAHDHHHQHNDHDHDHNHDDHHDDHVHEERLVVETRAADREGDPRPGDDVHRALRALLLAKGVVTADELRVMSERLEMSNADMKGAVLVARAWVDAEFRKRLLSNAADAAAELGIVTSNPNAPTVLTVVPNTPTTHNLVVCTLCSCYPSALLGFSPAWYKSREYR